MGVYLLRRLLLFLPTLLVVSVVIFFLSRLSPGDPIIQFIGDPFEEVGRGGVGLDRAELEYAAGAQRLGLDKPLFYLQLTGAAFPDTLYRILRMDHRKNLRNLIGQYGNWPQIEIYYKRLREASAICYSMEEQKKDWLINIRANIQQLFVNHQDVRISYLLNEIDTLRQEALTTDSTGLLPKSPLFSSLEEVKGTYARMLDGATPWKRYLPRLYWHGMNNQYHQWFLGILQGDWGVSMKDRQPVLRKIGQAAFWTLLINIPALLIAFGVAIPLGIWMARKDCHSSSGWVSLLLFFLYSLPNFWIATLLILFLTTPEYGEWLNIFPTVGLSSLPDSAPFWSRFLDTGAHLILPVFCVVYPSLAFIAQQVKGGMLENLKTEFVKTARSKGVSERQVYWKHAFRNALFPLITILGAAFASVLSGSVVIEFVFNIPGMGRLVYDAILDNDWPVIFGVVQLGAFLTILGYFIADLLYAAADPRVKFHEMKS